MEQTAVEWLLNQYLTLGTLSKSIVEQAKAMEKQQIIDTANYFTSEWQLYDGEQYYNNTFKSE